MCVLFISCTKDEATKTEIYNQKANELIFQTLKENKCNCILEIPKETMVEISNAENPKYDIRTMLKNQLKAKTNANLDSLINVSKKFKLDIEKIKLNKIKIVSLENIKNIKKGNDSITLKMCKNGIISIQKPIFDENYKKAVFEYNYTFTCLRLLPTPIYELKKDKWIRTEK
jgi:hypothetical protein